jgi:hypothetical protein
MYEGRLLATQKGWRVFPLVHRSRFAIEQPFLRQATSSVEQIEQWQREYPDCAWALATGPHSNVFALEASHDLGIQALRAHCSEESILENALQIRSQNRIILFFRWPNGGFLDANNYRKRVLGRLRETLKLPKLTFQVIRRTVATLSQHHGTVKDTQGLLRHARLPTTTDRYMQVIPEGVKLMVNSMHHELRKPRSSKSQ